jgi:hypothetical protein
MEFFIAQPATGKILNSLRRPVNRAFLSVSVLIVLFAAALRICHIGQRSLWFDEAVAANISRGTLAEALTLTRAEHSAPITHPLLLYVVEKIDAGPLAVRGPALVASVLAVFLMLCFVTIPSIDQNSAVLSALMLSVSAAQILYGQAVREYSLSVLHAALLLYLFMSLTASREKRKLPIVLYLTLFAAPLIQYGLVLFGLGILAALFILVFTNSRWQVRISHVMTASLCLAAGSLLSFMLTLRYQWGRKASYLVESYYTPGSSLPRFVWTNTHEILSFLLPGRLAAWISAVAIILYMVSSVRARVISPLIVLAFTSFGIVLASAVLGLYPYGPERQCMFLAPVVCLLGSMSLVQMANRVTGALKRATFVAIACVIVVSGVFQVRSMKPYAEIEDIQKVLRELWNHLEPGDGVYVYSGAVPAVDFYVKERDPRFTYGHSYRRAPQKYVQELLACLPQGTSRTWILFSHVYQNEDQRIFRDLNGDWQVEPTLLAKGSALYLARRASSVHGGCTEHDMESGDIAHEMLERTPVTDCARDSFWDWNIRASRNLGQ